MSSPDVLKAPRLSCQHPPTKHLANQAIAHFENAKETEFANRLQTSATAPLTNTKQKG